MEQTIKNMNNLQISSSEIESRLREVNKVLREHLKDVDYLIKIQKEHIERLENEILELKISNTVESKKRLRPKHLKII